MIHDVGIKKFLKSFLILSVVAFGASCGSDETATQRATENMEVSTDSTPMQSGDDSDTSVKSSQETAPDVKESEEEQSDTEGEPDVQDGPRYSYGDSDYLFDQEKLHTFELTLSDQDLAYLDSAPALEEYVPGTLTFEGETLPLRM